MILTGDVRAMLSTLPDNSVHMCVTSPPYWSLRDYGVPPSVWGGAADCEHEFEDSAEVRAGGSACGPQALLFQPIPSVWERMWDWFTPRV